MTYDPQKDHRCSIRLKEYNYTQAGAYFVTTVTQSRRHLFGEVTNGEILLSEAGRMVYNIWMDLPKHYPRDMGQPQEMGQPQGGAPTLGLPGVVRRFKTMTTKLYADSVKQLGWKPFPDHLWQRNYYEHIIRTDEELNRIREYILTNPLRWHLDRENPAAAGRDDVWGSLFRRASGHQSHAGGLP